MELETQIGPPSPHQRYRNPYFFEQGPPPADGRQARIRSKSEHEAYKAENKKPGDASNFGRAERMQKLLAARKLKQDQARRRMKLMEGSNGELSSGRAKGEGPPRDEDAFGAPNLHPSLRGLAFVRGNPPR